MGRRRRRRARFHVNLHRETMRGIAVLFIFALAGMLILSIAGLAGEVGTVINGYATTVFGWDYFLVPIVLFVIAAVALYPDKNLISTLKAIGILFFFLSFNGFLNLLTIGTDKVTDEAIQAGGGMVGLLFYNIFIGTLGFWGSFFVLLIIVILSLLIIFNAPLRTVVDAPVRAVTPAFGLLSRFSFRRNRDDEEDGDYEDEEEEEEEDEEEDEEFEEDDDPEFRSNKVKGSSRSKDIDGLGEKALTTRRRRSIEMPLDLLLKRNKKAKPGNIEATRKAIEETLREFGIDVEMGEVSTGPTVTQYTLFPPRGVKLSRILALQNDLALSLAAHPIRIEAPIPGTSLVGIEVPNKSVAMVDLRDLLESKEFMKHRSSLTFAVGKDVSGTSWITAIEKMPHLLVAGATGSGKSVCLNTIIVSLLYSNGPDDLKLILIDPKRVELTAYEGIPHLLVPPITKVDDAVNALRWTIREMERRLDVLSRFGAKDIKGFNKRSKEKMPFIAIIIDELADLMLTSGREVEAAIVRIAQLARATGIHLVIATQRPSVDVITGTIKANFPGRIAFAVASQTDSRTILDIAGAEKLLGRGDMLYSTAELSKPRRLQGVFVSENEIENVVNYLKHAGEPDYNYTITEREKTGTILDGADEDEELLEDAIQYILQAGKASTSMLQRRLKIGYSRAARIMDILEEKGVIGEQDGSRPREVLIESWPPDDYGDTIPTAEDDYEEGEEEEDAPDDEEGDGEDYEEEDDSEDYEEGEEESDEDYEEGGKEEEEDEDWEEEE